MSTDMYVEENPTTPRAVRVARKVVTEFVDRTREGSGSITDADTTTFELDILDSPSRALSNFSGPYVIRKAEVIIRRHATDTLGAHGEVVGTVQYASMEVTVTGGPEVIEGPASEWKRNGFKDGWGSHVAGYQSLQEYGANRKDMLDLPDWLRDAIEAEVRAFSIYASLRAEGYGDSPGYLRHVALEAAKAEQDKAAREQSALDQVTRKAR